MRAAIYARMSTDKQADTSPEDQVARCREYAEKQGWVVVEDLVTIDAAISGASRHDRPGFQEVFARIADWDVLVVFDFSRLTRNEEDQGWALNTLKSHRKTAVEAVSGLELSNIGARVMGVMNAEYRVQVSRHTHKGLEGAFDRKNATGGCAFGYHTVPIVTGTDSHGRPETNGYRLEVDPEQASTVERIFEGYAPQGMGLRNLAHQLNAEGTPAPKPRRRDRKPSWSPTSLRDLLENPLYRGERIWNRSYWVKDHETTKRKRFERPESEWKRQTDESRRIVSDELWKAAQDARGKRNQLHFRDGRGRILRSAARGPARRKRLLAGFLQGGDCGGSFHAVQPGTWGCSQNRNSGPTVCTNEIRISQQKLEAAVLKAVANALDEEVARHAFEVAIEELNKRLEAIDPKEIEVQIQRIDMKIEAAIDLAVEHPDVPAIRQKIRTLQEERSNLSADRARITAPGLPTIEELMPLIREKLADLRTMLTRDVAQGRLALGALMGGDRLRIHTDGRIEGAAWIDPEMKRAPRRPRSPQTVW